MRITRNVDTRGRQGQTGNGQGDVRRTGQGQQRATTTVQTRDGQTWTNEQMNQRGNQGQRTTGANGQTRTQDRTTTDGRTRQTASSPNGSASREFRDRTITERGNNGTTTRGQSNQTHGVRNGQTTGRGNGAGSDQPNFRPGDHGVGQGGPRNQKPGGTGGGGNGGGGNGAGNGAGNGGKGHTGSQHGGNGGGNTVVVNKTQVNGGGGGKRVVVHKVQPYHGVFVYGPAVGTHDHYSNSTSSNTTVVRNKDLPGRDINRANTLAIGVRGGSLMSGYENGESYGDLGLGLNARYRPAESIGLELGLTHHDSAWAPESSRSQTLGSASVELFAFPWTRVSPYAIGGLTMNNRNIADELASYKGVDQLDTGRSLVGAHAGLGLELALGKTAALDLEGRYIGWLNQTAMDQSNKGAVQATAGLVFHF
jgi:hypothetical protein